MNARSAVNARQSGVVLFISIIVLLAMSLAGLALMRSVSSGVLVAGNVSFKRAAASASDLGVELGREWLNVNANRLTSDAADQGYFASWDTGFDPLRFDWDRTRGRTDPQGHDVRFVIHRLCDPAAVGRVPDSLRCSMAGSGIAGSTMRTALYQDKALGGNDGVYYRITARVTGVRGTTSYAQALVQN
jgi:type IV pilus assembly protein PilX